MEHFNPETHEYTINGNRVPSVTQVLNDLIPCYHADPWYLARGNAVHACAAMIARGVEFEHDPQIDGQVSAVRKFMAEVRPVVMQVEKPLFSLRHGFAGTPDLMTRKPGKLALCVADWKASFSASLPYQLGGYAILEEVVLGLAVYWGYGVEIHEDGTYKMSEVYNLRPYKTGFLNLLSAYNIRRACKAKEEGMTV